MGIQRVFGITAPLVAAYSTNPTTPVFVAASLFIAASVVMLFLPFESRGIDSL